MNTELQTIANAIISVEPKFNSMLDRNTNMSFVKEASFVKQICKKNPFLLKIIESDLGAFRDVLVNIANIGVSLNPALGYAYLVPRDKKVCLDISYKGLVYLACRSGYIRHMSAEVVKEGDVFVYNGIHDKPDHKITEVFSTSDIRSKKKTIGSYCVAKMSDGSFMTEIMDVAELEKRSALSSNKGSYSVWEKWGDDIIKKTVIKRAAKSWISGEFEMKLNDFMGEMQEEKETNISDGDRSFIEGEIE